MLYKIKSLLIIFVLTSCHFEPVYKNGNLIPELCSIVVQDVKPLAKIYEINFKNELQYILCDKTVSNNKYILDWNIERSFKELIKSETNFTRRFEEKMLIKFNILEKSSNNIIYKDEVVSIGAYNILEDEIISTKASKESLNSDIPLNAAYLVLNKISLFFRKK